MFSLRTKSSRSRSPLQANLNRRTRHSSGSSYTLQWFNLFVFLEISEQGDERVKNGSDIAQTLDVPLPDECYLAHFNNCDVYVLIYHARSEDGGPYILGWEHGSSLSVVGRKLTELEPGSSVDGRVYSAALWPGKETAEWKRFQSFTHSSDDIPLYSSPDFRPEIAVITSLSNFQPSRPSQGSSTVQQKSSSDRPHKRQRIDGPSGSSQPSGAHTEAPAHRSAALPATEGQSTLRKVHPPAMSAPWHPHTQSKAFPFFQSASTARPDTAPAAWPMRLPPVPAVLVSPASPLQSIALDPSTSALNPTASTLDSSASVSDLSASALDPSASASPETVASPPRDSRERTSASTGSRLCPSGSPRAGLIRIRFGAIRVLNPHVHVLAPEAIPAR